MLANLAGMTAFEWVAVVGAAAWLPQIGALIYRVVVRSRLHCIPVRQTELTFNHLGPIFNMRAALVVERKDAVITEMRATLRHDKGREVNLVWDSFVEQFSELKTHAGERGEFTRDQIATALKVSTALPNEKFFRFQDPVFKATHRQLSAKADDVLNRLPDGDVVGRAAFLRSREFTDLISFYLNYFPWEPGHYDVELRVRLLGVKRPLVGKASLELSADDVDRVRRNLPLIEQRLREICENVPAEQRATPSFWATPDLLQGEIALRATR
jgi:hypothetical protein